MPGILALGNIKFPVVTLNFSAGGIFLKLDENKIIKDTELERDLPNFPHQIGRVVDLEIDVIAEARGLFKQQKFFTRAKVVWCPKEDSPYKYGLGLQFIDQSAQAKKQLKRYAHLLKSAHLDLKR